MVRPRGFEPLAFCSGGKRSIQLSYGRNLLHIVKHVVTSQFGARRIHGEVAEWSKAAVC
jgi:hypothetical protein